MDTTDTTPTTTDLVIIDAELVEETPNGNSIVNTVTTTAATSAVILGGMLAYKFLAPKVTSWFRNKKTETEEVEVVEAPAETPETEKV